MSGGARVWHSLRRFRAQRVVGIPPRARALWGAWERSFVARASAPLAIAAVGLLFLEAAGTLELTYTITVSQLLMALACVIGTPFVIAGWQRVPRTLRAIAGMLVLIYVLRTITGAEAVLPSADRAGSYRDLVYLADLALGLAVVGLIAGLWRTQQSLLPVITALFAGAAIAGLYGIYQLLARDLGLPLSDVNNAVNPDLVSYGDKAQGTGLFGIERIRGTFGEPHFLGAYLSALVPAAAAVAACIANRHLRRLVVAAVGAIAAAMILTASAPAWALLGAGCVTTLVVCMIARGSVGGAALAGAALAALVLLFAVAFASPQTLAQATGRTGTDLELTTKFRTEAWSRALDLWSVQPVLGHGPGQGSIRLASPSQVDGDRVVLGSAQGMWAASLVDVGIVGLAAWTLFIGCALWFAGRALFARQNWMAAALFTCAIVAVMGSQIMGDRLELRVWILIALAIAAATAVLSPVSPRAEGHG